MRNYMKNPFYQVGGSLSQNAPSYLKRNADDEYYQALLNGEFCYVLNARQTGKSSLKIQTMSRLQKNNIHCVTIDLGLIGTQNLSCEQFYASFLGLLVKGLKIDLTLGKWWRDHEHLSCIEKINYFFDQIILEKLQNPINIFIDEIDSILSINFNYKEFFLFIRQCYNRRAIDPKYQKLNFSILGTGNFLELCHNFDDEPFILGRHIMLSNFTYEEAQPLLFGLDQIVVNPQETLQYILQWTGGQPFLTQKLCKLLVSYCQENHQLNRKIESDWFNEFVYDQVIKNWEIQDEPEHLKTIRDRILNVKYFKSTLKLYQKILQGYPVKFIINHEHIDLCLSGLVIRKTEFCYINNPICQTIFNDQWLEEKLLIGN